MHQDLAIMHRVVALLPRVEKRDFRATLGSMKSVASPVKIADPDGNAIAFAERPDKGRALVDLSSKPRDVPIVRR